MNNNRINNNRINNNHINNRRRQLRKRKQQRRILVSILIEMVILALLAGAFCWDRGLKAGVAGILGDLTDHRVKMWM